MKTICMLFFSFYLMNNCVNYNEKEIKPLEINGELTSKEYIENGKYIKFSIVQKDSSFNVKLCNNPSTKKIYDFVQINDNISKDKGTLLIRVAHFMDGNIEIKRFLIE